MQWPASDLIRHNLDTKIALVSEPRQFGIATLAKVRFRKRRAVADHDPLEGWNELAVVMPHARRFRSVSSRGSARPPFAERYDGL